MTDKSILQQKHRQKEADRSGHCFVTHKEFYFFLKFIQFENHLWEVFTAVDSSDDRRITREEFTVAYDQLGLMADPAANFAEINMNHGGYVLLDKFHAWMAQKEN